MEIRPIIFMFFRYHTLSGGYLRNYEVLKRGKAEGVKYIIVTDARSCRNALKMFPDFIEILKKYRVYMINGQSNKTLLRGFKTVVAYMVAFRIATAISKIVKKEDPDLIVSPGEAYFDILTSYLVGRICNKPWTAVFQPSSYLLEPSSVGSLNPLNVMKHISEQTSRSLEFMAKLGLSIELYYLLKLTEQSLMLSVSNYAAENIRSLNPKVKLRVISPGNGIDLKEFDRISDTSFEFDTIFFGRLVPEKGLFDLLPIWKIVVDEFQDARLGIAGITQNPKFVQNLLRKIDQLDLLKNVVYLGELDRNALIRSIISSRLTLNPSRMDTFSLVTLESLACGTPVVAYDLPVLRENFGETDAVLICPLASRKKMAEKVLYLLRNPNERSLLSQRAKNYAESYDWRNVVKDEKNAYFDVKRWHASPNPQLRVL